MKLVMYVSNDFIDSSPVDPRRITEPGYIGTLSRKLKQKHAGLLAYATQEPKFLIDYLPETNNSVNPENIIAAEVVFRPSESSCQQPGLSISRKLRLALQIMFL